MCSPQNRIETIDGTAEAEKDYIPVKQVMVFEKEETHKYLDVEIIDDNDWEPDEVRENCTLFCHFLWQCLPKLPKSSKACEIG